LRLTARQLKLYIQNLRFDFTGIFRRLESQYENEIQQIGPADCEQFLIARHLYLCRFGGEQSTLRTSGGTVPYPLPLHTSGGAVDITTQNPLPKV